MQTEDSGRRLTVLGLFTAIIVFFMPFSTVRIFGNGLLLYLGAPLIALSLIQFFKHARSMRIDNARLAVLAFMGYYLFSIIWSPNCTVARIYELLKVFLLALCLICNPYSQTDRLTTLAAFTGTGALICGVLLFKPYDIQDYFARRSIAILGVYQDPNYLCFLLFCILAVCVMAMLYAKRKSVKIVGFVLTLVILYCIIRTGSRSALASGILMVLFMTVRKEQKPTRIVLVGIVLLAAALILLPILARYLPATLVSRFQVFNKLDRSNSNRLRIWSQAFQLSFSSLPGLLFGRGAGSSTYYLGVATHNHILQILLENGLVGLTLYGAFLYQWAKKFRALKNPLSMAIFTASVLHSMTLSVQSIDYYWVTIAFCMVVAPLELHIIDQEETETDEIGETA